MKVRASVKDCTGEDLVLLRIIYGIVGCLISLYYSLFLILVTSVNSLKGVDYKIDTFERFAKCKYHILWCHFRVPI